MLAHFRSWLNWLIKLRFSCHSSLEYLLIATLNTYQASQFWNVFILLLCFIIGTRLVAVSLGQPPPTAAAAAQNNLSELATSQVVSVFFFLFNAAHSQATICLLSGLQNAVNMYGVYVIFIYTLISFICIYIYVCKKKKKRRGCRCRCLRLCWMWLST